MRAATALLIVVPNRLMVTSPGTRLTLDYALTRPGLQVMVASEGDGDAVANWLAHLPPQAQMARPFKLMVAGPRASIWPQGELVTTELLIKALDGR